MKKLVTLGFLLTLSIPAYAGGNASGGGAGVVCYDRPSGAINSVELLDLYEAKKAKGRHALSLLESADDPKSQALAAAERISDLVDSNFTGAAIIENMKRLARNKEELGTKEEPGKLNTPADLGRTRAIYLPANCEIMAIGYRQGDGSLALSSFLYDKLSPTHKAAFWVHESISDLALKNMGRNTFPDETGTEGVRRLVVALFSENATPEQKMAAFESIGLKHSASDALFVRKPDEEERGHSAACLTSLGKDVFTWKTDPQVRRAIHALRQKLKINDLQLEVQISSNFQNPFFGSRSYTASLEIAAHDHKYSMSQTLRKADGAPKYPEWAAKDVLVNGPACRLSKSDFLKAIGATEASGAATGSGGDPGTKDEGEFQAE